MLFGVDVLKVQEIIQFQEMTEVPLSHDVVRGLVNLRGQIVTALDLHVRLDVPALDEGELKPINIVLCTEGGAVSLLVDSIGDVLTIDEEVEEEPPPTLNPVTREVLVKVCKLEDELLLVLDAEKTVELGMTA
ncbi:MAG: purine-binding chemotaxis protein CheW [Planctomycetota bacterium]|jgi:purine-binding chemotaxis protein CheW